jgi:hypothetical protein
MEVEQEIGLNKGSLTRLQTTVREDNFGANFRIHGACKHDAKVQAQLVSLVQIQVESEQ